MLNEVNKNIFAPSYLEKLNLYAVIDLKIIKAFIKVLLLQLQ